MAQITQQHPQQQLLWWQKELLEMEEKELIQQQPVSNYSYFQVEGLTIRENWLGQYSHNVVEYRHKIHSAMLIAQAKYLERKGEKKVHNQRESLVLMKEKDDFLTVNPKIPSLALNKRRLLKESRGTALRGRVLERYFVIDNTLITFFENESDSDFKRNCRLEGAYVFVESRSQYSHDRTEITWHDQNCEHRVQIGLPERQQNPVYFYTNDLNEAKILAARVYISSTSKKSQISDLIRRLSKVEIIFRFQAIWNYIFRVYEKRLLKMISFQIMGINLNELATTGWLQREKLFRFWSGQVLKREKVPLLRSTFRYGQIKRVLDPTLYRSSLMVRESLLKLVRAFKNRRLQRHSAIQQDIQALLEEEEAGVLCKNVKIFQQQGKLLSNALVKCENHKYLTLQLQQDVAQSKSVDFYEKNPPMTFLLENISCMATNFKMFDKSQQEYTLRIYGRCEHLPKKPTESHNITPNELGLDVFRRQSKEGSAFIIKVHSIELSIGFARRFSLKADLRVKLRQAMSEEQLDSSFYVNSRPYRINVPPGKDKGRMVLKGQDYTFVVDRIDPENQNETFKMCLMMQRNSVPVTQFMKEFLFEEEFTSEKTFRYEEQQDLEVKCSDSQGNKMKIKFSVSTAPSSSVELFERDGLRLLIGRYVIYQKRIALLKHINRDQTVDLQNLSTGTVKQGVKMKKVKMIEHAGVSVFDIDALPKAVLEGKFSWTIEMTTKSKRLVNMISSEVQNRQTLKSFSQRAYNRDKKRDIEGRIILSIIELMDLKLNPPYQVYARVTVRGAYDQAPCQVYQTHILEEGQLSWVDRRRNCPNGFMLDLGNFFYEEVAIVKIELFNRVQQNFNQMLNPQKLLQSSEENMETEVVDIQGQKFNNVLIGQIEKKSTDFIDIHKYGKETCLILEGSQIPYTFMVIQSLFIPSNVTRIEYQLLEDPTLYLSPEHYFHLTYQLMLRTQDKKGHYNIPMGKFNPNYLEKLRKSQNAGSPMLLDNNGEIDSRSSPMVAGQFKYSNDEEIELCKRNIMRPEIEEGALIFKYLWKYRMQQARQEAFEELQNRFWTQFLEDMSAIAENKPFRLEIKDDFYTAEGDQNLVEPEHKPQRQQYQPIHIPGEAIFDWLKAKTGNSPQPAPLTPQQILQQSHQHVQEIENVKQFKLMFYRIWGDEASQAYADTYYLIQSGVSSSQRVQIWKDLLRVEVYQSLEAKGLRKKYAGLYDTQKTVYQNLRDSIAQKHDCLGFRQIDEDIEAFQFPQNYNSNQVIQQKKERREMRNILKALIIWSRNKKLDGKAVNFSYTSGLMNILQRLLTIVDNEEDAFWILNGIVRMIPRLFSTDESCLLGGRNSVMRNEMTAFKAILRENLPHICDKLRLLGLPVDQLIYNPVTSFYAHYFSTEVVLRLWDLIIFNLSNKDKYEKKRALWYFMAPAYWILRERQADIISAKSSQEVYDLFMNGQAITYNPDWIVNDLKSLIKDIFVTHSLDHSSQNSGGLLNKFLQKPQVVVDHALKLEETRKQYEGDLSLIFNQIEEENKQIGALLSIETKKMGKGGLLDYKRWRQHVMEKFKIIAIKDKHSQMQNNELQIYEEPNISDRNDMDLAVINIYIHQLQNLAGIKHFRIKLYYGKVAPDGSFQTVEERFDDEENYFNDGPMSTIAIDKFFDIEYMAGYNHLKIEVIDIASQEENHQCTCDLLVDLRELNNNRFLKKHIQLRNEQIIDSVESYRNSFSFCVASLFLQTHTLRQHQDLQAKKNTAMSKFISSIKRKLPDRIDIFNKKNETEFVDSMKLDFDRIISEELQALKCFLPEEIAKNTINDNFNYSGSSYGNITLENLQYLVKQCFYQEWTAGLSTVYQVMTKKHEVQESPIKQQEEQKNQDDGNLSSEYLNEETQKFGAINETNDNLKLQNNHARRESAIQKTLTLPFSLRNFLVTLVLMSHCTISEKFDVLYDLMDFNDGVADGLEMNCIYLLVKTIFERNLYYCPSHELFNQLEGAFDISVSTVYQALWTQNKDLTQGVKLSMVLEDPSLLIKENYPQAIDVTEEIQETVNSYQSMFGNKLLDFNYDSSPFKNIGTLIKRGGQLAEMTKRFGGTYRLVIFYTVSGERYRFEVRYDAFGYLSVSQDLGEKDDIDEYLRRNINKLYLQGRSKGISKQEFISKTVQIPFLHDLMRVETLYRDRLQSTLHRKKKLGKELVILVHFDQGDTQSLLIFRFQTRVMNNVEGEMNKLDGNTYRVLMTEAFEEDCITDIRFRMSQALNSQFSEKLSQEIQGSRSFFLRDNNNKWVTLRDHDRLIQFQNYHQEGNEILMRLDFPRHQGEENMLETIEEERDLAGFDCFSLYRHSDLSYEWRLCKIMQREPIIQHQATSLYIKNPLNQPVRANYHYWIEFLHHRKLGQKLWLKRRREEILFSARYSREQIRNYEQETMKYVRDIYKQVFTKK